jgi:hypothetical protein
MLAEATNSDVITWGFVLVLTTIAANVVLIITTRRTQKREVSFGFEPASKEEFDEHKKHTSRIHDILFDEIRKVNVSTAKDVRDLGERVAGVETQMELMNQRTVQIDTKLDRLIERKH